MEKDLSLIEKVRKLLTLANDKAATENEAKTAMLLAQKLMAKSGLNEDDISEEEKKQIIIDIVPNVIRNTKWRLPLFSLITRNYRCDCYINGYDKSLHILGYTDDAEIAKMVFEYAFNVIWAGMCKIYDDYRKIGRETKGVQQTYAEGFIDGLRTAFANQQKSLMLLTPEEVKEAQRRKVAGGKTVDYKRANSDYRAYVKGSEDGKEFFNKRGIEA